VGHTEVRGLVDHDDQDQDDDERADAEAGHRTYRASMISAAR
jgi:hypothetical protein